MTKEHRLTDKTKTTGQRSKKDKKEDTIKTEKHQRREKKGIEKETPKNFVMLSLRYCSSLKKNNLFFFFNLMIEKI